jgi:hypothetical protein
VALMALSSAIFLAAQTMGPRGDPPRTASARQRSGRWLQARNPGRLRRHDAGGRLSRRRRASCSDSRAPSRSDHDLECARTEARNMHGLSFSA